MPISSKKDKKEKRKVSFIRRQQEEDRAKNLAQAQGLPYVDLISSPVEIDALILTSAKKAREGIFVPFQKIRETVCIATIDSQNAILKDFILKLKDKRFQVNVFICSKSSFERGIKEYRNVPPPKKSIIGKVEVSIGRIRQIQKEINNIQDLEQKLISARGKPGIEVIEVLLGSALELAVSDIHIEPKEEGAKLRYRIDGILYDIHNFRDKVYNSVLSRIKLFAELKLNVHNLAQDGRFTIKTGEKDIEVRTSIVPGQYGEGIVMRVLNPKMILEVGDLGLHPWVKDKLLFQIKRPNGMILTCGPTGSGKTTTLYACLKHISKPEVKVITIEDPIEYHLPEIAQTQVDSEKGYNFAAALRAAMRQDPDVVLVGEIRDRETAETALDAALTGHLVFSTLHTNSAAGVVPRLIEMGATPTSIAPAMNLAIAQRLIRRVCLKCAKEVSPSKDVSEKIKKNLEGMPEEVGKIFKKAKFLKSVGCPECNNTGYKGRIGIFEMFEVSEKIEEAIASYPSVSQMKKTAIEEGMMTMQQDGLVRVMEGLTTTEELQRITGSLE